MNFVTWHNKHKKKIKDMNPGDVFIRDSCLWMVSNSSNGVGGYAIKLTDGQLECIDKDNEYEMCMGQVTIGIGGLN